VLEEKREFAAAEASSDILGHQVRAGIAALFMMGGIVGAVNAPNIPGLALQVVWTLATAGALYKESKTLQRKLLK
jgi:hypothetical protein